MRDYGKVHTSYWTSTTIRSMTEDGRTLAMYLLTCPHGTIAGVFRLPDGYACEDLQWDEKRVLEGFDELLINGFANRCETTKWVWIGKYLEWNQPENPNQRKAAAKVAMQVPNQCAWKLEFMRVCGASLGIETPIKTNPSQTVAEPFLNQEQEQEQEQDIGANSASPPKRHPTSDAPTSARQKSRGTKTPLPADFGASDRVKAWAASKGFGLIDEHLDAFKRKASANGYAYVDWDSAFMEAIREDWAKLRGGRAGKPSLEPDGVGSFV